MTKTQLDNLIHFCFNFHETMGVNLDGCDAGYILEKWDKFIGIKLTNRYLNDSLNVNCLEEDMKEIRKCKYSNNLFIKTTLPIGIGKEDADRIEFLLEWSKKWSDYDKVKEILYFLLIINSKGFTKDPSDYCWTPSELVETFREWIGNPEEINKEEYKSLHHNVRREVNEWLETISVNRDYKLNILV